MQTALKISSEHPHIADFFRAQGAATERARIQAIEAQLIPGHEALINRLKFDGNSTAGYAAQAILAAEKTTTSEPTANQTEAPANDAPSFLPLLHLG